MLYCFQLKTLMQLFGFFGGRGFGTGQSVSVDVIGWKTPGLGVAG